MAREIKCVCGRRFHIGHSKANVQCRTCGRWWSGTELSALGVAATLLSRGEIARATRKRGDRNPSRSRPHRGKQTNRRRPPSNTLGSILQWLLG